MLAPGDDARGHVEEAFASERRWKEVAGIDSAFRREPPDPVESPRCGHGMQFCPIGIFTPGLATLCSNAGRISMPQGKLVVARQARSM